MKTKSKLSKSSYLNLKRKEKKKLKTKQKEVSDEENNMFYLTFFLITISLSD